MRLERVLANWSFFAIADTVHLVFVFDHRQLFIIWFLLLVLAKESCIRMDATVLLCMHHLFQLHGIASNTLYYHDRNISEKNS